MTMSEQTRYEALQEADEREARRMWDKGYERGQRDALAGAVQRVEALLPDSRHGSQVLSVIEVIAAIKGGNDE
jgi:hypothetical protein